MRFYALLSAFCSVEGISQGEEPVKVIIDQVPPAVDTLYNSTPLITCEVHQWSTMAHPM